MLIWPESEARRGTSPVFNPITRPASAATRMELLQLRSSGYTCGMAARNIRRSGARHAGTRFEKFRSHTTAAVRLENTYTFRMRSSDKAGYTRLNPASMTRSMAAGVIPASSSEAAK